MELSRHRYSKDLLALAAGVTGSALPYIRGQWFFVNPDTGDNDRDGLTVDEAVADLLTAYNRCTSGAGDGIVLFSAGTGTAADTTSYLKQSLAWSKHGVTLFGLAAPVSMYGRARVANVEVVTTALETCAQTANAITREAGSFLTDGWVAGMKGVIVDSGSNNAATFTVTVAEALSLTVSETLNVQTKAETVSTTLTSYIPEMVLVSGDNNRFLNFNIGNWSSHALSLGGIKVTGNRNYFGMGHAVGAGHATPGAVATAYDLLVDGGQENDFERITFGTDTILKAAANAEIVFDGTAYRTRFRDCDILCYSETAGKGAVKSMDATALSGFQVFSRCRFMAWKPNGLGALTSAFIGTKPTSGQILMDACSLVGWAAWDSVGANDTVYIGNSAAVASGAGGIATAV
jgi:hypothetical protein